ncbi:MAG: DUF4919 domain-containing protein [Limnohabitans sp.]|nr:DUF4919 domain-containing protein [Limnohabitans sp.]
MKYYLLLILFSLNFFAQEVKFEKPNFESIKKEISTKDSEFFYPKLLERLSKKDETLKPNDFKHLYFGYFFQKNFSLSSHSENDEKLKLYYSKEKIDEKDYPIIIDLISQDLKKYPFDLRKMNFLAYAYHLSGNETEAKRISFIFHGFIDVILSTGDGKTCETGFVVNDIGHEYVLMHLFQLESKSQGLTGNCDYHKFEKGKYKVDGLYFYIEKILEKETEMFSGK